MKHFFLVLAMLMTTSFLLVSCGDKTDGNSTNKPANNATSKPANTSTILSNPETFKNSIGLEFVRIPSGVFIMGSPTSDKYRYKEGWAEEIQHQVTISKDFYIGKYEVTQAQWKVVMRSLPAKCDYGKLEGEFIGDNKPIICVNWEDAQDFVRKLNAIGGGTYRLPSEAEWEYAARGGNSGKWSFGDDEKELGKYAWYFENAGGNTHEVGMKQPNEFGLYDMHGNVWEWCQDWLGAYPSDSVTDPRGATSGTHRVNRGGSWLTPVWDLRSATRYRYEPSNRGNNLGFRVVRQ